MEVKQSINLLDLPSQILEKIVDHLPFVAARKNLRLSCRQLYNLCNSEHFCQNEIIVWPNCDRCLCQIIADFSNSSRGFYNLRFKSIYLKFHEVSAFFQQHGAKVRFLHFDDIIAYQDLFESIASHCGGLVSLMCDGSFYSDEPDLVPCPSVTSLVLQMKLYFDSLIEIPPLFHQMPSIFPCVKHLKIIMVKTDYHKYRSPSEEKPGYVLDVVSNLRHLQSLDLHMLIQELPAAVPQFPKLKDLRLHLDGNSSYSSQNSEDLCDIIRNSWPIFISRFININISSIKITKVTDLYLCDILPSLNRVCLERLWLSSSRIHFNIDDYEALVSSHLKIMRLNATPIAPWAEHMAENLDLEANKTVTDLEVGGSCNRLSLIMLFSTHFRGLVHLEMDAVNDDILQRIFKYQQNLRSLNLWNCEECSIEGFCGGEDGPYKYTITDLQKLELLQIEVEAELIQSERFQAAFCFPRLQYLEITHSRNDDVKIEEPKLEIPVNLMKSCINLAAVNLDGFKNPSSTLASSLFQDMKYLNYVNVSCSGSKNSESFRFTYVNLNHFYWINWAKSLSKFSPKTFYHDQILNRTVFTSKKGHDVQIHAPKISSKTVDWITIDTGVWFRECILNRS